MKYFLFLLLLNVLLPCPIYGLVIAASRPSNIIVQQVEKFNRLKDGIQDQQSKIITTNSKKDSLYLELNGIDKDLQLQQQKHLLHQKKLLAKEEDLLQMEDNFHTLLTNKRKAEAHVKNRLLAFYQHGEIDLINALFSSSTLPDLLNMKTYFHSLFEYDQQLIGSYQQKLTDLTAARTKILKGKEELLLLIVEIKEQEQELINLRQERLKLLARVRTEETLYRQALTEMEKSAAELQASIKKYRKIVIRRTKKKKKIAHNQISVPVPATTLVSAPAPVPADKDTDRVSLFMAQKGMLSPPVAGAKLTNTFGKKEGRFGATIISNGIDLKIIDDTRVTAVYNGTVVYADELAGYGNLIIVDHGQEYFSIVSRLTTIIKKRGEQVITGEIIGLINRDQSGLINDGLHFEIRNGSTPEDPLPWLKKGAYKN